MSTRLLVVALSGALLAGCASVPMDNSENAQKLKAFAAPAQGKAAVYVYREDSFYGAALKKDLWVDGKCLGNSAKGVFFRTEIAGGQEHDIATASEFSPNHLKLPAEAGKTYFVRQYIKFGVISGGAALETVDEAKAKAVIAELSPAVAGACDKASPD